MGYKEDMQFLKDRMVKRAVREHDVSIPDLLAGRLVHVRTLSRADRVALLRDETGIAPDDRRGFHGADLVMEAKDAEGAVCHVAVEASYTADRRDSDRVLRNAEYLTRCTGRPAIAVVASPAQRRSRAGPGGPGIDPLVPVGQRGSEGGAVQQLLTGFPIPCRGRPLCNAGSASCSCLRRPCIANERLRGGRRWPRGHTRARRGRV